VDTSAADKKKAKQAAKKAKQATGKERNEKELTSVRSSQKQVQSFRMEENLTEEVLEKRVGELVASRGRKGTDAKQVLYQLEVMSKMAKFFGPRKEIPVLMHLISAMFDSNRSLDDYMDLRTWRTCRNCMMRIVNLLHSHKQIVLGLVSSEDMTDLVMANHIQSDLMKRGADDDESAAAAKKNPNELRIVGSLENYLIRLEDEYTKSLQQINPHTQDYVVRLSDEALLLELAEGVQKYYTRVNDLSAASRVALLRVEHLYYKHDSMASEVHRSYLFAQKWGSYTDLHPACTGKIPDGVPKDVTKAHPGAFMGNPAAPASGNFNPCADMEGLCSLIFKTGDERSKTRALLCAVYYHSLHDRYHRARDMFLISRIQDSIDRADTSSQILYNRALVTLGLCAFRLGLITKAYESLAGVCSNRAKELLAQGTMRYYDRDVEQENAERRRQVPYHMHINPELLECCYLICAMIVELPHIVGKPTDARTGGRQNFRKYLQSYNRQVFTGPPENTKEHVLAAAKALIVGDLARANSLILNMDVWNLIPNNGGAKVKEMLSVRLKEEALRTYLFSSVSANYQSLCLSHVCSLFDMDTSVGRRIISRMIFHNEVVGAWDQSPDGESVLVLHKVEATPVQTLALQVADKMKFLVESNERMLDPLNGAYGYKDEWVGRDGRKHTDGDRQQGGRNASSKWRGGVNYKNNPSGGRAHGGGRGRGRGGGGGGGSSWSNQPRSTGAGKQYAGGTKATLKESVAKKTSVGWANVAM
jgi:translation initiation factor 3 subunit C